MSNDFHGNKEKQTSKPFWLTQKTETVYYLRFFTGWSDSKRDNVTSIYWVFELKINKIKGSCMFIGNGHFTFILWIKFLSHILASTASNRKTAKKSTKIVDFWWSIQHWDTKRSNFGAELKETWSSVSFLMKWGRWGHWGHWGCRGCWGHWGSWWPGNHSVCKVQSVFDFLRPNRLLRSLRPARLSCLLRLLRPLRYSELLGPWNQ